jgi:hypothetical protein
MDATHGTVNYNGTSTYATLNLGSTYNNLVFNGSGGSWSAPGDVTVNGSMTLADGTYTAPAGTLSISGNWIMAGGAFLANSGTVAFNGTGTQTFDPGGQTFYNVTHSGSGTLLLINAPLIVNHDFYSTAGTFDLNMEDVTIGGDWMMIGGVLVPRMNAVTFNGAGVQTVAAGQGFYDLRHTGSGTLQLVNDPLSVTNDLINTAGILDLNTEDVTIGGNWIMSGGTLIPRMNTVTFNGAGVQLLNAPDQSFYNLVHSGSGILRQSGPLLTVTNRFNNTVGTFELNGNDWQMTGAVLYNSATISLYGNETISGLTKDGAVGTWRYTGDGIHHAYVIADYNYYNLVIDGVDPSADVFRLEHPLIVYHDLSILSGELDSNSLDIRVGAQWNNQGVFDAGTGTVILNGRNQSVLGSSTFYNLSKESAQTDTLVFEAGQTQTVQGVLTLGGVLREELLLRSSLQDVQWIIDPQGKSNVNFADLQNSHNISGAIVDCIRDCVDSGNNTGYRIFGLGFDPLANLNLNYIQVGRSGARNYFLWKKKSRKSVYVLKKAGTDKNIKRSVLPGLDGGGSHGGRGVPSPAIIPGIPVAPAIRTHT